MSFYDNSSLAFLPSSGAGKDGKAYSIKPTNGTGDFTFSRGSNLAATRVGPTGLIEKGRENLLLQSNQFDTTWAAVGINRTSGQSGYDGTNNAWKIESTNTGQSRLAQTISISGVNTISFYAKAGTANYIVPYIIGSGDPRAFFNLSTGVVGTTAYNIDASMEDVGEGWYRCSMTLERTSSSLWIFIGNTDNNFNSAIGDSIYIQDAQLEVGLAATDYIESGASTGKAGLLEDEPRFDYSGGATCPSLLLEPSRTNLVKYSEYFEGTGWLIGANTEKVSSNNLSPSGELNAYKFKSINITGSTFVRFSAVVADNTDYTFSCYARSDNPSALTTGKLLQLQMSGGGQITSISSTLVTSEWQRFDITATSGTTSTAYCYLGTDYDVDAEIEFWGAQLEQGSYPTSYIPNHSGGTITRGADGCENAGDVNTFNSTEGVLYLEASAIDNGSSEKGLALNDGSTNNRINIRIVNNDIKAYGIVGGSLVCLMTYTAPSVTGINKIAFKYKENDFALWVNGVERVTDNSGSIFPANTLNELSFDYGGASAFFYGNVKQVLTFNTALSDADLATLTTI